MPTSIDLQRERSRELEPLHWPNYKWKTYAVRTSGNPTTKSQGGRCTHPQILMLRRVNNEGVKKAGKNAAALEGSNDWRASKDWLQLVMFLLSTAMSYGLMLY
ncbi:hypothetical protein CTI12_AA356690 [Artemisia annua]|uniref:Uncharacterized protein n=1 Tax=Artemisia annua TaxID=35608 RepID=A0A2U1MP75_ARTAN|nr:hypothetical protein CTI12_AA356690 [Artemisia annua]